MPGFPQRRASRAPRARVALLVASLALAVVLAGCGRGGAGGGAPAPAPIPDASRPEESQQQRANSIDGSEMRQSGPQRIEEYLNGRVPGLQVLRDESGRYSLRIRGAASLGKSDEEPLIVIDGIPMAQGSNAEILRNLDPREIARIDVLKDASQTAMYGSRGANGVLVIRTRRP